MSDLKPMGISRNRCREIMTKVVVTATPDMALREVAAIMRDGDMGAVPVLDAGRLAGIVTDRDIVIRAIAEGLNPDTPVGSVMTSELFTVGPEDFVFEAIRLMGDRQIRRIPVVGVSGELVGIIAIADVALETEDEREIADALEEISSGAAFWKKH